MCYSTGMHKRPENSPRNAAQAEKIENFAQQWILSNVATFRTCPTWCGEVDRLASKMTADARQAGISAASWPAPWAT